MLIDTHCHLNFKTFEGRVEEVIGKAKEVGVGYIVVPGTDIPTSKKAVEIAEKYQGVYSAVGIHPHHVYQFIKDSESKFLSRTSQKRKNFFSSSFEKDIIDSLSMEKVTKWIELVEELKAAGSMIGHPYNHSLTSIKSLQYSVQLKGKANDLFNK